MKEKKKVLIIGNGVSRLELKYKDFIRNWTDEIWVCNRAYLEHNDFQKFTRMIGDFNPCNSAVTYKYKHNLNFDIYLRYEGWRHKIHQSKQVKQLDVPDEYRADSGSTFVIQAILEKYDEIYVVGMDLGGADIYVTGLYKEDKSDWVDWWRRVAKDFSLDKVTFIGMDHKKFILSDNPRNSYAKVYLEGKDHLSRGFKCSDNLLIIGNGESRLLHTDIIHNWKDDLWVCDKLYLQYYGEIIIDRVMTAHTGIAILSYLFKQKNELNYQIYTNKFVKNYSKEVHCFSDTSTARNIPKNKWCTYSIVINQALVEGYKKINIIGFDSLSDEAKPKKTYDKKFIAEYKLIYKEQKIKDIKTLNFIGESQGFLHII